MATHPLYATQHVRRLSGGSQAQLLRASDGHYYVTKFQNNPQHVKILANEMLATRIGIALGLPMPTVTCIAVSDWLIQNTPELRVEISGVFRSFEPGLQLASRYAEDPHEGQVFDYLPESLLAKVENLKDFARALVFDKWASNADGRQAVFSGNRKPSKTYRASFIDQGYCFNAREWDFLDSPLRGVYARNCVYEHVTSWGAFEPVLTRAEQMDAQEIWRLSLDIPEEWYECNSQALTGLIEALYRRRLKIRDLITSFRRSSRNPFPNWTTQ